MKDTPFIIVSAYVYDEILDDMYENHPSCIHQIVNKSSKRKKSPHLLSALEYDSEQQELKDLDLINSVIVEGDDIWSLSQYSDDSFIICGK